ncbi:MAG: hypothetical protein AAFV88_14295 [Planctomycetota bacterium]
MSAANPYDTPTIQTSVVGRRTFTLKTVDPVSCGLVLAVFYAILGLLVGGFFSLFAVIGLAAQEGGAIAGLITGIGAIIVLPLLYGAGGFIGGLIAALIYNVCAGMVGGLKIDLEG